MTPDRAAFIAAIMLCEAEEAMESEKKNSRRWREWQRVYETSLRLFAAYDRSVNKNDIYARAARVVDIVNEEMGQ